MGPDGVDGTAAEDGADVALQRLLTAMGASFEQRAHLERALQSRITIEQAKGMLAERLGLSLEDAFELMRRSARSRRRRIHDVAHDVLTRPETPREILEVAQEAG